jgi:hypothetical protein
MKHVVEKEKAEVQNHGNEKARTTEELTPRPTRESHMKRVREVERDGAYR